MPTPKPITSISFVFDGDGSRVKSVISTDQGSTITLFVDNYYELTGSIVTKYYYAGTQRIAMRVDGTLSFLFSDHLGSTSLSTDANGAVTSEQMYLAWGEVRFSSGDVPTNYTYTGQYSYTANFGLMFYNARWYDGSLGRFAQADSIVAGGMQGHDRYAYSLNSPTNFNDPSGHMPTEGCGDEGKNACHASDLEIAINAQKLEKLKQGVYNRKCSAGNDAYCSTALKHPVETIAFVGGGLLLAGVGGAAVGATTITAETATTATTTITYLCANDGDCTNEIQTGTNMVYQVVQNGRTIYVGITQNFPQRAAYWLNTRGWRLEPIRGLFENLSRFDARAAEQVLIEHYGLENLANQINSIAATNPIYQAATQRGNQILNTVNFFGP